MLRRRTRDHAGAAKERVGVDNRAAAAATTTTKEAAAANNRRDDQHVSACRYQLRQVRAGLSGLHRESARLGEVQ